MKLILHGTARASTLKEIDILPDETKVDPDTHVPFATGVFTTRTSSSEREVLDILGFNPTKPESFNISQEDLTPDILEKIHEILDAAGCPTDVDCVQALQKNGTFSGFIACFE